MDILETTNITEEQLYIRGCMYAIFSLMEKGSVVFAVNTDNCTKTVEWNKIIDFLVNKYEECEEK